LAGLVCALLLIGASSASAATFCVQKPAPACTPADGINHTTLQAAFDAADTEGTFPGKDRIEIGAVDLPDGGANTSPVELVGSGSGAGGTSITDDTMTVLNIAGDSSTIQDLGIVIGDGQLGLLFSGSATNIHVVGTSTSGTLETGVFIFGPAPTLSDSEVDMATTPGSGSIGIAPASGLIERTDVEGESGILGSGTARRVGVVASATGIGMYPQQGGNISVDQATIRMLTPAPGSEALDATAPGILGGTSATVIARHVTAVGPGSDAVGARAVGACAPVSNAAQPASLTLENTILRGFGTDIVRQGSDDCDPGGPVAPSTANVTAEYSIFDPGKVTQSGAGVFDQPGMTNINVDPLFVGAIDFHLQSGSPAIDAGDPDPPGPGQSDLDLDGNPRVLDGDGNGTAIRDIGAYERPAPAPPAPPSPPEGGGADPSPPDTTITAGPKKKSKKKAATFAFSANEPATFACALDGKDQFKPCTSPLTVKVKKGKHTFEVRATDAAGNTDPTPATQSWKVSKKK